jgi:hypothetical protein
LAAVVEERVEAGWVVVEDSVAAAR